MKSIWINPRLGKLSNVRGSRKGMSPGYHRCVPCQLTFKNQDRLLSHASDKHGM